MSGSITPILRDIADRVSRTLDLGIRSVARTYERTGGTAARGARTLDGVDSNSGHYLLEETRTMRQPNPMRTQNYVPSAAESAMAARRMTTTVEFTGDMRVAVEESSTDVFKMRSTDGQLNIYKPMDGEGFSKGRPFEYTRGALTNREVAAYRVDEILGFGRIPPTARTAGPIAPDGGQHMPGMIQQFVESRPSRELGAYPRNQQQQVGVVDYIIGAMDRHSGNFRTVDRGTHLDLVAIDHGRSFPHSDRPLYVEIKSKFVAAHKGQQLEPDVLHAVQNVDTVRLRAALGDAGLHPNAINGAMARLEKVQELGQIPASAQIVW
ncbi:hypothetical protein AB0L82_42965 [Nocardia sp. NPDC052001]|uniref:hypothetical protein n=1 Tax=Nocardia sp. NPDC052001 TaxID=3154853 RepID=UPI00341E891C